MVSNRTGGGGNSVYLGSIRPKEHLTIAHSGKIVPRSTRHNISNVMMLSPTYTNSSLSGNNNYYKHQRFLEPIAAQ